LAKGSEEEAVAGISISREAGGGPWSREGSVPGSAIKNSTGARPASAMVCIWTMTMAKVLVFDLDGTLYDASCGYVDHIRSNIFDFMYEKVLS
jgi:hypothetical protein